MRFEGFGAFRKLRRDVVEAPKKAAATDPLTGKTMELGSHERSHEAIWQDPVQHERFLRFLTRQDRSRDKRISTAIVDALVSHTLLTDAQQTFVDEAVSAFNIGNAEMERLGTLFTQEYVRDIGDANPKIALMVRQIGLEKAHELLQRQFETLFLDDRASYDAMVLRMSEDHAAATSGWTKSVNARARFALEQIGMTEDKVGSFLKKSMGMATGIDSAEKQALKIEAQKHMGVFMTLADIMTGSKISGSRAEAYASAFEQQRDALQKSDLRLDAVGRTLLASITPEMRLEIQRAMIEGGEVKQVPETTVHSIKDMRDARAEFAEDAIKRRYADALKAETVRLAKQKGIKPENMTLAQFDPADKDAFFDSFTESEVAIQRKRKGRGIFAAILALFHKPKADIRNHAASLWH